MVKLEKRAQKYQEERLADAQEKFNMEVKNPDTSTSHISRAPSSDPDILMTKTRNQLESIYMNSAGKNMTAWTDDQNMTDELYDEYGENRLTEDDDDEIDVESPNHPIQSQEDDYMEDWMKQRIKKAVNSLESVKRRNSMEGEEQEPLIPYEENPIFKAFREGTLSPKDDKPKPKPKELGPYPGDDHFIGIWRVVTSPTGFNVDDSSQDTSENFILRVDGTTAGGPTLNLETKQKAAGGTWKMLPQENGDVILKIRLVIPPEKNRILVMEGRVNRVGGGMDIPMARRTFGIPEVEERAKKANEDQPILMSCSGEVHIEDAITKKNRERIGEFTLMKLRGLMDSSQYTITVPKPIRLD
jgi:hypothetical protein